MSINATADDMCEDEDPFDPLAWVADVAISWAPPRQLEFAVGVSAHRHGCWTADLAEASAFSKDEVAEIVEHFYDD